MFNLVRRHFKLIETLTLESYESCGSVVFLPQSDSRSTPLLPREHDSSAAELQGLLQAPLAQLSLLCVERMRM